MLKIIQTGMNLTEGTLLQGGKYKIIRKLGQGGFGITYLAIQTALDRKVAVKEFFMPNCIIRDGDTTIVTMSKKHHSYWWVEQYKQKFIKEAKTIASLDNPHIIRIHDVFEENDTAYYVMEYLEGGDLKARIPQNGMDEAEAIKTIRQIAEALQYMHSQKILHLDIKPSNILYRNNNTAVLIDFGISKHYDGIGEQTSHTPLGISEGYAPLEQYELDGMKEFSPASDIYALGATFYQMVTGKRPPSSSQVLKGLPPLPSSLSKGTVQCIQAAMKPIKDERTQTIQEFVEGLEYKPTKKNNRPKRKRIYQKKYIFSLLAAIVLIAIGISLFSLKPSFNQATVESPQIVNHDTQTGRRLSEYIDLSMAEDGVYAVAKNGWGLPVEKADTSCIAVALIQGKHRFWIEKNGEENVSLIKEAYRMDKAVFPKYTAFTWGVDNSNNEYIKETELAGGNSQSYSWGYLPYDNGKYFRNTNPLSGDYKEWNNGALSDFNGKENTIALIGKTHHETEHLYAFMATYAKLFNDSQTQNKGYSDWYVPALGQLALISLNKQKVDEALLKIGGVIFKNNQYWSCTEHSAGEAWGVNLGYGGVWHERKDKGFNVRLIRDNNLNKVHLLHIEN